MGAKDSCDLKLSQPAERHLNKGNYMFNQNFLYDENVCGTLVAREDGQILFDSGKYLSDSERIKISSFPADYKFKKLKTWYIIGMSVPPVMMAQIATEVHNQWLSKINIS